MKRSCGTWFAVLALAVIVSGGSPSPASAGTTERVSVSSSGEEANVDPLLPPYVGSCEPSMSGDGRFVAFISCASNLVAGDTNGYHDVFVHDRLTGMTERVSVSSAGEQGDADAHAASISAGGRFVAFDSWANNLVSQPTAVWVDAFLRDRLAGTTELVSVSSSGEAGNCESSYPSVSADGRFVAFLSLASNLVPGEQYTEPLPGHPFGFSDIFVRDRLLAGS